MTTTDFCQRFSKHKAALMGLLCCFALTANAEPASNTEPPSIETLTQSDELVLTLSDKWAEPDKATQNLLHKPGHATGKQLIPETPNAAPAIGCGMAENPIPTLDNSLTSRVVGKCNFNYQY